MISIVSYCERYHRCLSGDGNSLISLLGWACVLVLIYVHAHKWQKQEASMCLDMCVLCMCIHVKQENRMPAESRRAGLSVRQVLESLLGSDKCIMEKPACLYLLIAG